MQAIKLTGDLTQDDSVGILFLAVAILAVLVISMLYTQHILTAAVHPAPAVSDAGESSVVPEPRPAATNARLEPTTVTVGPGGVGD